MPVVCAFVLHTQAIRINSQLRLGQRGNFFHRITLLKLVEAIASQNIFRYYSTGLEIFLQKRTYNKKIITMLILSVYEYDFLRLTFLFSVKATSRVEVRIASEEISARAAASSVSNSLTRCSSR